MANDKQSMDGEGLSSQVQEQIRKEAISQVAKWAIAAFAFFIAIAASGWWLYLQEKLNSYIANKAGGVPPGRRHCS